MPTISYGPPGHHGVTRLIAVGDAEYAGPTDQAIVTGTAISGAVMLAGLVTGSRYLRTLGAGATLALLAVRLAGRKKQVVAAAASAPVN